MPQCSAIGCTNRNDKQRQKSYHRFPFSRPQLLSSWIRNIRRDKWMPSRTALLCSDHFEEGCFDRTGQTVRLRNDALPTVFNFSEEVEQVKKSRKLPIAHPVPVPDVIKIYQVISHDHHYNMMEKTVFVKCEPEWPSSDEEDSNSVNDPLSCKTRIKVESDMSPSITPKMEIEDNFVERSVPEAKTEELAADTILVSKIKKEDYEDIKEDGNVNDPLSCKTRIKVESDMLPSITPKLEIEDNFVERSVPEAKREELAADTILVPKIKKEDYEDIKEVESGEYTSDNDGELSSKVLSPVGKKFGSAVLFNLHRDHFPDHRCVKCRRSFSRNYDRKRHELTCGRFHQCRRCGRRFRNSYNGLRHENVCRVTSSWKKMKTAS